MHSSEFVQQEIIRTAKAVATIVESRIDKFEGTQLHQFLPALHNVLADAEAGLETEDSWRQLSAAARSALDALGIPSPEGGWEQWEGPGIKPEGNDNAPQDPDAGS